MTGVVEGDAGVPHGRLLVEFAEAALGEDEAALLACAPRSVRR